MSFVACSCSSFRVADQAFQSDQNNKVIGLNCNDNSRHSSTDGILAPLAPNLFDHSSVQGSILNMFTG